MGAVPEAIASALLDSIGDDLVTTITAIRTEFESGSKRFSGTGLLLLDSGGRVYCLTADHVVSPKRRSTPIRSSGVVRHYHSQFLEEGGRYESFALRSKYYKSESVDLAMLESCLSETEMAREYEDRVMTLDALLAAGSETVFANDILVMAGLPAEKLSEIPITRESNHGVLFNFFYADQGRLCESAGYCYEIPFSGEISPEGMSGSPVWVVRVTSNAHEPLDHAYVTSTPINEQRLSAAFLGLATHYQEHTGKVVAVRPAACAAFVKKARSVMPTIRLPEEDEWIKRNLHT